MEAWLGGDTLKTKTLWKARKGDCRKILGTVSGSLKWLLKWAAIVVFGENPPLTNQPTAIRTKGVQTAGS